MIHDFRTSEVLVPMVLVYLYLDPIYVNVNPITFCLSDLDLVIRKFHPHKCNTRHCLLQLLYIMARALWEPFRGSTIRTTLPGKYAQLSPSFFHQFSATSYQRGGGGLALEQLRVSIPLLRTLGFPPVPLFSLPPTFRTEAQRPSEMKGRTICLLFRPGRTCLNREDMVIHERFVPTQI